MDGLKILVLATSFSVLAVNTVVSACLNFQSESGQKVKTEKSPLQNYHLYLLDIIRIYQDKKSATLQAEVKGEDGRLFTVCKGDFIGRQLAKVDDISANTIVISQLYPDELTSRTTYYERKIVIPLNLKQDEYTIENADFYAWNNDSYRAPKILYYLASRGDKEAQYRLARLHMDGWLLAKDMPLSQKWMMRAASAGHADAQNELALLLLNQGDSAYSKRLALRWLRQAANQGNQYAQYNLARAYLNEFAEYQVQFPVDYRQGAMWLEKAADKGHVSSIRMLANLYKKGRGVENDAKKAFLLLDKAAFSGDRDAMFEMALMIKSGILGVKDEGKVFMLLDKAAHAGHAEARKWLADAYNESKLISQNSLRSFVWYVLYLNKDFNPSQLASSVNDWAIKQCQQAEASLSETEKKAAREMILGLFGDMRDQKKRVFDKKRTVSWSQEHVAELEKMQFKDLVHEYFRAQQPQISCQ